ncbi:MAG: hypothetical protein L7F77_12970 [Candidatus Magnetominusculus sp. LBB02]|nr:hypothetical protein [Candidatus Magnetominusculus sp. LBB02]
MAHVRPDDVTAPKHLWELECVFYDEGADGTALSFGRWENDPYIGIRWNGHDVDYPIGNPQSSGHPTWFILPIEFGSAIVKDIIVKRAAGNTYCRDECLNKVIEWLEQTGKIVTDPRK